MSIKYLIGMDYDASAQNRLEQKVMRSNNPITPVTGVHWHTAGDRRMSRIGGYAGQYMAMCTCVFSCPSIALHACYRCTKSIHTIYIVILYSAFMSFVNKVDICNNSQMSEDDCTLNCMNNGARFFIVVHSSTAYTL